MYFFSPLHLSDRCNRFHPLPVKSYKQQTTRGSLHLQIKILYVKLIKCFENFLLLTGKCVGAPLKTGLRKRGHYKQTVKPENIENHQKNNSLKVNGIF